MPGSGSLSKHIEITTCDKDAQEGPSLGQVGGYCMTPWAWTSRPTGREWKLICLRRYEETFPSYCDCWTQAGLCHCRRMTSTLLVSWVGRMTQTTPLCSSVFSNFCTGQRRNLVTWKTRLDSWLMYLAGRQSTCCTGLLRSSSRAACRRSFETSYCNGSRKYGSKTVPDLEDGGLDQDTPIGKTGRKWSFKYGLCRLRRWRQRRVRCAMRGFFLSAYACLNCFHGLYTGSIGTKFMHGPRLGPKSEPCVVRHGRALRLLWLLLQMEMVCNAGGVRVVHSHPMCTGAVPAAANHGGSSDAVEPPNFPKARKRAYMRALQRASASSNGGTWYRGRFLTLQQLQGHQRPAATGRSLRDENVQAGSSRLRVVVWNCGGLHSERYQEILVWLHEQETLQKPVDVMVLVETSWKEDMEFVTTPSPTSKARWYAIHSGSNGAQGGILCLISQRLAAAPSVQFTNVLQGRLLHVRIPFQAPLDLLCVYQYAWNTQKKFEDTQGRKIDALLKQRKTVWNHITQWMRRTPQRNGCILLGDFNTPLLSCGLHVGHGVMSLSKAIQTDQEIFQDIVQSTGCCALNTWSKAGKAAKTFLPAQGNSESGTQIDFLIARGRLADGKAKACSTFEAPFIPSSGCRHLPLQCTFVKPRPPMTPGQSTRASARQAQELMKHDAVRCHYKEQVLARVESAAEHEDLDIILRECWQESCDRFRKTNVNDERDPTHSLPSQRDSENLVQQLWSTRTIVRQQPALKHADLHALFEGWKLASTLQRISRQLRKASKRRKLELVERVVGSTNVFKAAKILHPKTPKRRLQLRDSEGRIQTREAEFEQLTSFFRQLYDGPPSSTWTISCNPHFTKEEVRNALLKFCPPLNVSASSFVEGHLCYQCRQALRPAGSHVQTGHCQVSCFMDGSRIGAST